MCREEENERHKPLSEYPTFMHPTWQKGVYSLPLGWHARTTAYSMNPYISLHSLPVHTSLSCLMLDGKPIQAAITFLLCTCTAAKTGEL